MSSTDSEVVHERRLYTLVFVFHQDKVLLGMKKRGFGAGRWNGFGGKVEPSESIQRGAVRELFEESGMEIPEKRIKHAGQIDFTFVGKTELMQVDVFSIDREVGDAEPTETDEMAPKWFPLTELPFDKMWPDDKHWFPFILNKRTFMGKFHFEGHDRILHHELRDCSARELAGLKESETDTALESDLS